jgi:hypothetical protein
MDPNAPNVSQVTTSMEQLFCVFLASFPAFNALKLQPIAQNALILNFTTLMDQRLETANCAINPFNTVLNAIRLVPSARNATPK